MLEQSFYVLKLTSLYGAVFFWATLLFLDRSTERFRIFWFVSLATMLLMSMGLCLFVDSLYIDIIHDTDVDPKTGVPSLTVPFLKSLGTSYLGTSFYLLIVLGWYPPKLFGWRFRISTALATTAAGLFLSISYDRDSIIFLNEKSASRQEIRNKELDPREDWTSVRAPDPEKGPQTEGEWRWLGFKPHYGTTYSAPGMQLSTLDLNGPCKDPERTELALEMLKHAKDLKRLRFRNILSDDQVEYLLPLTWLRELEFERSSISDAGVVRLRNLDELRTLRFLHMPISDKVLDVIPEFKLLGSVTFIGTEVTSEGIDLFALKNELHWRVSKTHHFIVRRRSTEDQEILRKRLETLKEDPIRYQQSLNYQRSRVEALEQVIRERAAERDIRDETATPE